MLRSSFDGLDQILVGIGILFEKRIEKKGTWKQNMPEIRWKAPGEISQTGTRPPGSKVFNSKISTLAVQRSG